MSLFPWAMHFKERVSPCHKMVAFASLTLVHIFDDKAFEKHLAHNANPVGTKLGHLTDEPNLAKQMTAAFLTLFRGVGSCQIMEGLKKGLTAKILKYCLAESGLL